MISSVLLCLSVLPAALRAQGYQVAGDRTYHASSIYYVTLQDAAGESINSQYAAVDGAIGGFVGSELRGVSQWVPTGNKAGQGVFVVRVWGDENDPSTATFRLRDQRGLEYQIASQDFSKDEEGTYGSPSAPIAMTLSPVTGIALPVTEITLKQGENYKLESVTAPAAHSTLLTTLTYTYSSDNAAITVSENGMVYAGGVGQGTITVKAAPGNFTTQLTVKVEKADPYVPVTEIRNNMNSNKIELREGERVILDYTILPENASNKAVSVAKNNYNLADILQETETSPITVVAKKVGKDTIVIRSQDNESAAITYYINIEAAPQVTMGFSSTEVMLSKLHDTVITLTKDDNADIFLPSRVSLAVTNTAGGHTPITCEKADNTGLKWKLRGIYVGQYTLKIVYNGKEQDAACKLKIPAEYKLDAGWNWLSLYAVGSKEANSIPLTQERLKSFKIDNANFIVEIRSQEQTLYYDPEEGYFGGITRLTPTDGMYKIKAAFREENADKFVINAGYENLVNSFSLSMPRVGKGYTWVTYPHETDHSVKVLSQYLSQNAAENDMILGQNGFAEYDGEQWQTSEGFKLEAGKGYIYYTEDENERSLNWGPSTLGPDPAEGRTAEAAFCSPWADNSRRYADCMPVVAQLEGIASVENYCVGAFVNGECRGWGTAAANGLLYITVNGEPGDRVSFRLYNKTTEQTEPVSTATIAFAGKAGSHREPIAITGISSSNSRQSDISTLYDLTGRTIDRKPSKGIYVETVTESGRRITRKIISK